MRTAAFALGVTTLALSLACGDDDDTPTEAAPATDESEAVEAPTAPVAEAAEAPERVGDPVDLLGAAPTAVAVSSAYRDRESQVPRLFDGDLETAWNSRSEDLVGAWIEVRVPDAARVTGVALTAGFTKPGGQTDLFTGNHRVKRVRLLRNGQEVATRELDVDSRELQILEAAGEGGVWRIEITEVVAGSKEEWKEICISELQVLGHLEGAQEGTHFPRFAVGSLPVPPAPVDREAMQAELRLRTHQLAEAWREHEEQLMISDWSDPPGWDEFDVEDFRNTRRRLLGRFVELLDPAVPEAARVRRRLHVPVEATWESYREDLDAIAAAMGALMEWSDRDEDRCRWAKAHARLRLERVDEYLGHTADDPAIDDATLDASVTIGEHLQAYPADSRTTATRLLRMPEAAPIERVAEDWRVMREQLELAQRTCGWE